MCFIGVPVPRPHPRVDSTYSAVQETRIPFMEELYTGLCGSVD